MTRLIAITGPDGSGKTTTLAGLRHALADRGYSVGVVQIWDALGSLLHRGEAQSYLRDLDHLGRGTLLLHALARSLELGLRDAPDFLLLDGYWFKYAVSERAHGGPAELFAACPDVFPAPERVFFLDVPLSETASRKVQTTAYERGHADETQAFEQFQERMRPLWRELEGRLGPWTHVDGMQSTSEVCVNLLGELGL